MAYKESFGFIKEKYYFVYWKKYFNNNQLIMQSLKLHI